jgi:hypothetical protein
MWVMNVVNKIDILWFREKSTMLTKNAWIRSSIDRLESYMHGNIGNAIYTLSPMNVWSYNENVCLKHSV